MLVFCTPDSPHLIEVSKLLANNYKYRFRPWSSYYSAQNVCIVHEMLCELMRKKIIRVVISCSESNQLQGFSVIRDADMPFSVLQNLWRFLKNRFGMAVYFQVFMVRSVFLHSLRNQAHIENIYVFESYRRKGVASNMVGFILRSLKKPLTLYVDYKDARAQRFYEKNGFARKNILFPRFVQWLLPCNWVLYLKQKKS
jgi:ribosomal protein S18 acetylase RimI-like enzyme